MSFDHSILLYFLDASPVVKAVMGILLAASLLSWTIIFQRGYTLRKARREFSQFQQQFWSGVELSQLYQQLNMHRQEPEGASGIFIAGYREYTRLRHHSHLEPEIILQHTDRAMRIAYAHTLSKQESQLSFLATVGSTCPFIGLFGTVWGIMTSFHALGSAQQASIAMVAPGISEALVATAMGLFAAIPAVIFYNRYTHAIDRLMADYETFQEEFSSMLHRQMLAPVGTEA